MPTEAAVGLSLSRDSWSAGSDAALQCRERLGDERVDLCLVFATAVHDQQALLQGVVSVLGEVPLSGCSGEGVIGQDRAIETDHAVSVLAVRSSQLVFDSLLVGGYAHDPTACGAALGRRLREFDLDDALGLLVFVDGLRGNCTDMLGALQALTPPGLVVIGGAAADDYKFERTFQYFDGSATSDAVSAVLIRGEGTMEVAVSHGCQPVGLEREVTRASGGWIHEIDHSPAWSVFREYLDGDPRDLSAEGIVHLCVGQRLPPSDAAFDPSDYGGLVIRTPLQLDQKSGSLYFPGGGIAEGQIIQMTRRDPEEIRRSARQCCTQIQSRRPGRTPALVLQFDCAGRGRILFGSSATRHTLHPLQEVLGRKTPWIGFHSYGEIAPIGQSACYHNYSVALCALFDGETVG